MRIALGLLLLCGSLISNAFAAGPATRLIVNCVPSVWPPASTICFNATLGKPVTVYVLAADAVGNVITSYTGTVHVTSSDPTASLPLDHTFTAADGGIWSFPVTFHSVTSAQVPSPESITATDAANSLSGMQFWSVYLPPPPGKVPALSLLSISVLLVVIGIFGVRTIFARERA